MNNITERYNNMTQLPSRESLFGTGQPQPATQETSVGAGGQGNPFVNRNMLQAASIANPSGMPNGVVPTQMQTPQEQVMMQQQQSAYAKFEGVLIGMFELSQEYPQFAQVIQAMAQQINAFAQQIAVEASQQRIPNSIT